MSVELPQLSAPFTLGRTGPVVRRKDGTSRIQAAQELVGVEAPAGTILEMRNVGPG